ncbi:D-alanyl-lipoteichoic acid biosynthesis protein DltD [Clostridium sp. CCUG 7971]|uniref:D-alanyl-lipoteichoic acid biosynthesis protein DltD n=1 Tax=Clostridium sp. CCUG 7971 TaxID=2811414 RepID=UPI001ABB569A|nr:D-alanyl-lipoteichoic acid biosynthesis protein DltD [Clostridium sp. CCUG 7971]MBO3445408.1 D-alanyl-lipoteichoic acid biosynthesis protein DltD [Clostridium sp. CCUG 7971]
MKKLGYILMPITVGVIFVLLINVFLDFEIKGLLKEKDLTKIMNDPISDTKDKGSIANNYFLSKKDILMMGSSELSSAIKRQHPTNYFNTNRSKNGLTAIGRPFTQSLQHTTTLGSLNPEIKDRKVVLLVSMQWFMDKEGVSGEHYQLRFSPSQFYNFLDSNKLSKDSKDKLVARSENLLSTSNEYKPEYVYSKLYNSNDFTSKTEKFLLKPYFELRKYFVRLKEKGLLYKKLLCSENAKSYKEKGKIDWEKEKSLAIEEAKHRVGNNELAIDQYYYNENFKEGIDKFKDRYKDVNLLESVEFKDYELELQVCKELGIKPVVVVLPSMDRYYNLTGISKEERHEFYDKVIDEAKKYDFESIDLRDKETEKYYLRDVMHLGTKGWVDLCEKLYKKFDQ